MAVNISGLRRNIKNVAHNYTDAQVKVREATSNDPWGPSSTMMSEIADLTYNVVAFTEIMQMIWKRLNDHGRNWRHVYKALVLLEYLIKTGSEKVAQQCKENIYAIQTLKDFQYLDDNKDQGINVREKAKSLVALLKDDERLRNERVRALKAKERFAQSAAGIGSDTVYTATRERQDAQQRMRSSPVPQDPVNPELEAAMPQTAGEEELQLQLALAMSREEAEQEETKSKSDDMRLQLALQKSKEEVASGSVSESDGFAGSKPGNNGNIKPSSDLLDLDFGNPVAQPPPPQRTAASSSIDPWGMPVNQQQQQQSQPPQMDPWGGAGAAAAAVVPSNGASASPAPTGIPGASATVNDPWSPVKEQPRTSPLPNLGGPPSLAAPNAIANDPWSPIPSGGQETSNVLGNDAWGAPGGAPAVPPTASTSAEVANNDISIDPFSPVAQKELTDFDLLRNEIEGGGNSMKPTNGGTTSPNPFDLGEMGSVLSSQSVSSTNTGAKPKKSVQSLLGEHSNLVNLDNLVTDSKNTARNPFEHHPPNPFQAAKTPKPAMNQLLQQQTSPWQQAPNATPVQPPQNQQQDFNPFF